VHLQAEVNQYYCLAAAGAAVNLNVCEELILAESEAVLYLFSGSIPVLGHEKAV
jgi:hypothetical protein